MGGGGTTGGGGGTGGTPGGECSTDAECASSPNGKVCDKWKNQCVGCVTNPADTCPASQYCDYSQACQPGCKDTKDCGTAGSCATTKCDSASHQCVGCCGDDNCPLGNVCDTGQNKCVPGCTNTHGCDGTKQCCTAQCYDLSADKDRCGACDKKCALANATPKCVNSACDVDTCNTGFDNCNGNAADGCELNVSTDSKNCGKCGVDCSTLANVSAATCSASKCVISKCADGFGDCDSDGSNGCEADLNSDARNCTACGKACPAPAHGTGVCEGGACNAKCNANYADCDGDMANGCEGDLLWGDNTCGKCGVVCGKQNTNASWCAGGNCAIICTFEYNDCDKDPSNGCEKHGNC